MHKQATKSVGFKDVCVPGAGLVPASLDVCFEADMDGGVGGLSAAQHVSTGMRPIKRRAWCGGLAQGSTFED